MGKSGDMIFSAFHSPGLLAWHGRLMHILSLSENVEVDKILPRSLSLPTPFQGMNGRASFFEEIMISTSVWVIMNLTL